MVGQGQRPNTSEYRRSYKESKFRCASRIYEDNFDYRQCRRQTEHDHNTDVFSWNEPNWDSESGSSTDNKRPASVPIHMYKHQKLLETYSNRLNKTQEIQVRGPKLQTMTVVNGKPPKQTLSPKPQVENKTTCTDKAEAKTNDKLEDQAIVKDQAQQTSDKSSAGSPRSLSPVASTEQPLVRHQRPKKPSQTLEQSKKKFVPRGKTFPGPVGRPLKQSSDDKAPFVAYGSRDDELETGAKQTHNVRASHSVYPSALRALQRRKLQMEKEEREAKSAPHRERRKKALFNDFDEWVKRETSAWDTEYRRHFVGYNSQTYERNLSARMNPAQRRMGEKLLAATA